MNTLRVLLADAPSSSSELEWALFDAAGACTSSGRARPNALPRAERFEAVIAAARTRLARVALPPMASSRVAGAAIYALEDQLAGPPDAQQLVVAPRQPDGAVRVAIVECELLQAIANGNGLPARPVRIVAECDLAPPASAWRWCASADRVGFVRCSDGTAFPVDVPALSGELPCELALALAQAARGGAVPAELLVDAPCTDGSMVRWQRETGVAFRRGAPWRWHGAPPTAFSAALDLLPGACPPAQSAARHARSRLFATALGIALAALALHVAATVGEWAWFRFEAWREVRAWTALAETAGIAQEAAANPSSARGALMRRYADVRHAQGLDAPSDALPLLARAAPALAALPPGTVRSARYADGHWTLDLTRPDAAVLAEFDERLRQAGVPALSALAAGSARVRIGLP